MCTREEGVDALLRPTARRNGCGSFQQNPRPKPRNGSCHGLLLTKRAGMSSRLGAGVCSSSSVPRAAVGALNERGPPISLRREAPSNKIRGAGSRVGLGIRHDRLRSYHRVRGARSCVPPPLHARARSRGPWLAPKRSIPLARSDTEAALVKNEGASPRTDARTDRVEEGSDDAT